MTMHKLAALAAILVAPVAHGQQPIPVWTLGPPTARTTQSVGSIATARINARIIDGLRELPDGRVLVNDLRRRQLVVFDSSLATFTVLADSAGQGGTKYPAGRPILIPWRGDSTLLLDPGAASVIVIDPSGALGRVMALPNPQDVSLLVDYGGWTDARGGLLYHAFIDAQPHVQQLEHLAAPSAEACAVTSRMWPDSATILRADFGTRRVDTIAKVKMPYPAEWMAMIDSAGTLVCARQANNPMSPMVDAWVTTSDGSVAIVRGRDYHIDWITAEGARTSAPGLPFAWRAVTEEEKRAKLDTARRRTDSLAAAGTGNVMRMCRMPGGAVLYSAITSRAMANAAGPPGASCQAVPLTPVFAAPADMPDSLPPIRPGNVTADRDGNVWSMPTTSRPVDGALFDVVNPGQGLHERVRIPPGQHSIAGFGRGGTVYLSWIEGNNWYFERRRIVRDAPR